MSIMRRIYQHFPSRPLAESLVALGHLEEQDDGTCIVHLDAYPAHSPQDGNFRLLVLPRQPAIPPGLPQRQTGIETKLAQPPTHLHAQAARVRSDRDPTPLTDEEKIAGLEADLEAARAAVARARSAP